MLGILTEFSRSGELGGAACCLSSVAGGMGGRLGLVWRPGGGDEGVSMSIAGCYDRGTDPGRNSRILTTCCIENPRAKGRTALCTIWGEPV